MIKLLYLAVKNKLSLYEIYYMLVEKKRVKEIGKKI